MRATNLPGSTPALSSSAASNVSSSTRACWALPEGWAIDAVAGLAVAILEGKWGKVGLMWWSCASRSVSGDGRRAAIF